MEEEIGKGLDAINSADKSSKKIEDRLEPTLGKSIILVNDIEEEVGLAAGNKNKPYVAIEHVSEASFNLSPQLEGKIRVIYA